MSVYPCTCVCVCVCVYMYVCVCVCVCVCAASDVGRAVLEFGAGHPLGEKGLDWLKIHLVNLHGHKKK